jgi:ABC-type iron transport system FetAB permease component
LGYSVLSAAFAGAMLAAPRQLSELLSLPVRPRHVRWLAARDLVIGATLLKSSMRRRGLAMRSIADATDAALMLLSLGERRRRAARHTAKAAIALVSAASALGLALKAHAQEA